jgi:hypothetical protein
LNTGDTALRTGVRRLARTVWLTSSGLLLALTPVVLHAQSTPAPTAVPGLNEGSAATVPVTRVVSCLARDLVPGCEGHFTQPGDQGFLVHYVSGQCGFDQTNPAARLESLHLVLDVSHTAELVHSFSVPDRAGVLDDGGKKSWVEFGQTVWISIPASALVGVIAGATHQKIMSKSVSCELTLTGESILAVSANSATNGPPPAPQGVQTAMPGNAPRPAAMFAFKIGMIWTVQSPAMGNLTWTVTALNGPQAADFGTNLADNETPSFEVSSATDSQGKALPTVNALNGVYQQFHLTGTLDPTHMTAEIHCPDPSDAACVHQFGQSMTVAIH